LEATETVNPNHVNPNHKEATMPELQDTAASVGAALKEKQQTVAVSESSCGGLLSACLVSIPGASAYYVGGAVVYTRTGQKGLLHVPDEAMANIRASTEEYALLNARTVREALGTTWALSETGASGPTGNRYGDSAGHACIAVSGPVERSITVETGNGDREGNMWVFAREAFNLLEQCLQEAG
jgi:PncC family amidohydrolase